MRLPKMRLPKMRLPKMRLPKMSEEGRRRLRRLAPWIALPLVAVVAFALGTSTGGDAEEGSHTGHARTGSEAQVSVWTCSMHPQIRQAEPGQCPICGMNLIPVAQGSDDAQDRPERIQLSERAKILARIRTAKVRRLGHESAERRLLGRVDYDETTLRTVTAWTGGRIDRLHVKVTGQGVGRGQVVATLYSPEIYSAHQDLLQAKHQVERLASGTEGARTAAAATLDATRERLRLLGVPDTELSRMEEANAPWRQIPIRSPFGGTVVERLATEGAYVQTGTGLYRIAQLGRLWVQLDAYESDLPHLTVGQTVSLGVQALPGETFEGEVAFVDPFLDHRTRTARVRIQVQNQDRRLRPGMFAEAVVQTHAMNGDTGPTPLVIPASAPLFTGRRSVVYVEVPEAESPTYEARVVRLGPRTGESYPVVAGIREGERVVVNGAFVLDADLQIRGGTSMMTMPDDTEHGPLDDVVRVSDEVRRSFGPVMQAYLALQAALAADDLAGAKSSASSLREAAMALEVGDPPAARTAWRQIRDPLVGHAMHLAHAGSLEDARTAFESVSEGIVRLLRAFGNPLDEPIRLAFCPMAFGSTGAEWLQRGETTDNPYFGESMRTCGEIRQTLEPGGYLAGQAPERQPAPAGGHQH